MVHILNFNGAYFAGQGMLSCACINKIGKNLRKVSPLCMNDLCVVLLAAVTNSGLTCTVTLDFKEVAGPCMYVRT